jgi:two-component sensor histidine kinase
MPRFPSQNFRKAIVEAARKESILIDVLLAVALIGLAFVVRWALGQLAGNVLIFSLCYPAVLAATLIGGVRCGLISLALSAVLFWWAFMPPSVVNDVNIGLYVAAGAIIIWISSRYQKTVRNLQAQKAKNDLLMYELGHRSKNSLAVISSIVTQSLRHDPEGSKKIIGRIAALKHGEELLFTAEAGPVDIRALLIGELAIYDAQRVELSGPPTRVTGELARTLCMIAHELATNALKYGAWSKAHGKVTVSWGVNAGRTYLYWSEEGGPHPVQGVKAGFGTFLIERLLSQHDGEAHSEYGPSGIVWHLTFANPAQPPEVRDTVPVSEPSAIGVWKAEA